MPSSYESILDSYTTKEGFIAGAIAFAAGAAAVVGYNIFHTQFRKSRENIGVERRCLELGADIMQNFDAPKQHTHGYHIHGYHVYADNVHCCVEAHHFCSHLTKDFHQCLIYDSDKPNARLIGIEYIISKEKYANLPEEEQKLWHSHVHEVKGGVLSAPGLPAAAENKLMDHVINTYGKTYHLWRVDEGHEIPLGGPNLMMAFTEKNPTPQVVLDSRDKKMNCSAQKLIERRKDIEAPVVHPNADSWEKTGEAVVFVRGHKNVSEMKKPEGRLF